MIPVVRQLVEVGGRIRVHPHQPVQPPFRLIQDIGDTVGTFMTVGIVVVTKSFRIAAVGKEHLINRVGRRGYILQVIGGIVPPAGGVEIQAVSFSVRITHRDGIMHMTGVTQEGIVPTTLLTHILEWYLRRTGINIVAYLKWDRLHAMGSDDVGAGNGESGEIETGRLSERPERAGLFHLAAAEELLP